MNNKDWDRFDLADYVSHFSEIERDNVLKQIVESELLADVFNTTEGKILLSSVVDNMTANTMHIISIAVSEDKDRISKITQAALMINILYRTMFSWAGILSKGEEHKEKIKKRKK